MPAPKEVLELVERFQRNRETYENLDKCYYDRSTPPTVRSTSLCMNSTA